jgi:hypothetical protein
MHNGNMNDVEMAVALAGDMDKTKEIKKTKKN